MSCFSRETRLCLKLPRNWVFPFSPAATQSHHQMSNLGHFRIQNCLLTQHSRALRWSVESAGVMFSFPEHVLWVLFPTHLNTEFFQRFPGVAALAGQSVLCIQRMGEARKIYMPREQSNKHPLKPSFLLLVARGRNKHCHYTYMSRAHLNLTDAAEKPTWSFTATWTASFFAWHLSVRVEKMQDVPIPGRNFNEWAIFRSHNHV